MPPVVAINGNRYQYIVLFIKKYIYPFPIMLVGANFFRFCSGFFGLVGRPNLTYFFISYKPPQRGLQTCCYHEANVFFIFVRRVGDRAPALTAWSMRSLMF